VNRNTFIRLVILGALVGLVGCRLTPSQPIHDVGLYPTPTVLPTQTPFVVEVTTTALPTQTPNVVIVSPTPDALGELCVTANEAVYLRPSPNVDNYPIQEIPNGSALGDLGGRNGNWAFVELGENRGWVNMDYLGDCR
jgi:hypothetical protein